MYACRAECIRLRLAPRDRRPIRVMEAKQEKEKIGAPKPKASTPV